MYGVCPFNFLCNLGDDNLRFSCNAGDKEDMFSVVVEHNGIFCGIGESLSYVSPSVAFVDDCSTDTWSILWIDEILKQLGYERDGRLQVYWCKPDKALSDGLLCIQRDADILAMTSVVKEHKTLVLMIDHSNFLKVC